MAERGRMGWQKASGYNRRALAEAAISRYKRVIGDALHSRPERRQATEVVIAVRALNRMLGSAVRSPSASREPRREVGSMRPSR